MFRSVYRLLLALNGPREHHEYSAALLLAFVGLLNVMSASLLTERFAGFALLPNYGLWLTFSIFGVLILLHYIFLVSDGEVASQLASGALAEDAWAGAASFMYVIGSVLVFLNARG